MKNKKILWLTAILLMVCLPFAFAAYEDQTRILGNGDYGDISSSNGVITLDSGLTNDIDVADGGTGVSTLTDHGVVLGSGASDVTVTDSGADGEVLVSNGAAADPDWEYIPRQNLLKNTQWIFMANADTARGQATMNYDAGSTAAPTAGLAITGGTSGATAKLISVTTATGTWAGNNATGVMTLGACAGCFHDNETVSFTGGTAVVNMPNSAVGVGKIQNGSFSVDTDPPPGWTAGNAATLHTEAGGKVGNCLEINCDGTNNPHAYSAQISVTASKTYYFVCYVKAGTEATYKVIIYDSSNSADIYDTGSLEETAGNWSTSVARYFTAPTNCSIVRIYLYQMATAGAATTMLYDEISLYEVAPGCTAADNLAFDGWHKDTTLDVYQEYNGTNTQNGSFYAAKLVPSAVSDFIYYPNSTISTSAYWYEQFQGKTITLGGWVLSNTADDVKLYINDGVAAAYSSAHTGGGTYEWLEVTRTVSASATTMHFGAVFVTATPGIAYVSQPMFCFGSSIGAGNYVPEADRKIIFEMSVASQAFNNKTGANGFSDVSTTTLNYVSDSGGCIGHGCQILKTYVSVNDSGSNAGGCYFKAGKALSTMGTEYIISPEGLASDRAAYGIGYIPCTSSNTYQYAIEATGGSTFDISAFRYIGAEWR